MQAVVEVLGKLEAFLAKAGIDSPKIEAEWLMAGLLDCRRLELFLQHDKPVGEPVLERLRELAKRRAAGEPLAYILGYSDFHDIRIGVGPGVLIPRPETEELVERVLKRLEGVAAPRIVDLGTGSGAIALALARGLPQAKLLAVEHSAAALRRARANAESLGLRERVAFRSGDWLEGLDFTADCIVANPPYLTEAEWRASAREVREHEPREALVADDGGMADLKTIIRSARERLADKGFLALEMGIAHGEALGAFAREAGYASVSVERDVHRRERFFFAIK